MQRYASAAVPDRSSDRPPRRPADRWSRPSPAAGPPSDPTLPHHAAWRDFNRRVGNDGDVGIWHETFQVTAGHYETIYGNMPRFGLATAGAHVPVARKGNRAAARRAA
jgi:Domain of unknown function (DUF4188)